MADRTVKVSLVAQASQYISEFDKASSKTKDFGDQSKKSLAQATEALHGVGVAALAMGTVAAAGLAYMVKTTADFDAQMSQVQTLSHATAGEMTKLRDAALTAGQGIGFTADQVADAEAELTKAGVSVSDQLKGGLVGALDLAAAGQLDVADATSIAAAAMTQFGLSGKDVPHIADLLAAGADKALGSVQDLGNGLKFVGPLAKSMGVSIESTVGTLAEFAQAGILGEQAGTELRGVLLSLSAPSKQAADVMKKYGISIYDAQGQFIGLDGVAQQLQTHLGKLTQAQRNAALGQIFGNAQVTAATVLMQGGAKAVDKWTDSVNDQGFAAEQAAGKMDNLEGDAKKLAAAFQTDVINAGEGATGVLRDITKEATTVIEAFGKMPAPVQEGLVAVTALTAGVGLLGGAFILGVPKVVAFGAALDTLAESQIPGVALAAGGMKTALGGVASFLTGPWGLALGIGATLLGGAFLQNSIKAQEEIDAITGSLDKNTGAFTKNTKGILVNSLQKSGTLDQAKKLGIDPADVVNASLGDPKAIKSVDDAYQHFIATSKQGSAAANQQGIVWSQVMSQIGQQSKIASDSVKSNAEAAEAAGVLKDAQKDLKTSTDEATESIAAHGRTLDASTVAGRANQKALDDLASSETANIAATQKTTANQEATTQAWEAGRAKLTQVAAQMGLTGKAADDYVNKHLGKIPPVVSTNIALTGAAKAAAEAQTVRNALASIQRNIDVSVSLHGAGNLATTGGLRIVNANGNILDFYANGGESHTAQISAGVTRVWAEPETGGEAYIPLAASKRPRSLAIWQATGKRLGVQGFADGAMWSPAIRTQFMPATPAPSTAPNVIVQPAPGPVALDNTTIRTLVSGLASVVRTDSRRGPVVAA